MLWLTGDGSEFSPSIIASFLHRLGLQVSSSIALTSLASKKSSTSSISIGSVAVLGYQDHVAQSSSSRLNVVANDRESVAEHSMAGS